MSEDRDTMKVYECYEITHPHKFMHVHICLDQKTGNMVRCRLTVNLWTQFDSDAAPGILVDPSEMNDVYDVPVHIASNKDFQRELLACRSVNDAVVFLSTHNIIS